MVKFYRGIYNIYPNPPVICNTAIHLSFELIVHQRAVVRKCIKFTFYVTRIESYVHKSYYFLLNSIFIIGYNPHWKLLEWGLMRLVLTRDWLNGSFRSACASLHQLLIGFLKPRDLHDWLIEMVPTKLLFPIVWSSHCQWTVLFITRRR